MAFNWSSTTFNIRSLYVETDAKLVKNLIFGKISEQHPLSNLIFDCRFLMAQLEISDIEHIYREINACADLLANKGIKLEEGLHIFISTPSCIVKQLVDDARG
ncbi:hypothetical protein ACSBR1_034980 [Camellia fascicularis]